MLHNVSVRPGALILLAVMLLFLPLQWVGAFLTAAAFHEVCHLLAARILGYRFYHISIDISGARIELGPMSQRSEMLCAVAGPLGGILLLLLTPWFPRIAICSLVQSLYNLLPIYPLDGGRALIAILAGLPEPSATRFYRLVEWTSGIMIVAFGVYLTFQLGLGMLPVFLSVSIIGRSMAEKYLANMRSSGYNSPTI